MFAHIEPEHDSHSKCRFNIDHVYMIQKYFYSDEKPDNNMWEIFIYLHSCKLYLRYYEKYIFERDWERLNSCMDYPSSYPNLILTPVIVSYD